MYLSHFVIEKKQILSTIFLNNLPFYCFGDLRIKAKGKQIHLDS